MCELLDLFKDSRKWAQKNGAWSITGSPCSYKSSSACCWCIMSGLKKLDMDTRINHIKLKTSALELEIARDWFGHITRTVDNIALHMTNDKISHSQLLLWLREAQLIKEIAYCGYGKGIVNASRW